MINGISVHELSVQRDRASTYKIYSTEHTMSTETEEIKKMTGPQKILATLVLLIAAYAFTGFLVAPHLLKWILEKKLSEGLHRQVTIGKIYLNPFSFSMDAENFVMRKRNGDEKFLSLPKDFMRICRPFFI